MDGKGGKPFDLLVTNVIKLHGLIRINGQTDLNTADVVKSYLSAIRDQLEAGQPAKAAVIVPGQSVIARHDGVWYRAKVNTLSGIQVSATLVDTGQIQVCNLTNIRTEIHSKLQSIPPLAQEFVLGEVVPPAGDWSKPSIEFVRDGLQNDVCKAIVIHRSHGYNFIRVFKRDSREPFGHDMVQCGMAVSGYPSMDNIPPADNYTPPQLAVPPMIHHQQQQSHQQQHHSKQLDVVGDRGGGVGYMGPPSPNYPPPSTPGPAVSPRPGSGQSQHPQPHPHPHHHQHHQLQQQFNSQQVSNSWSDGTNGRATFDSSHSPIHSNATSQGFGSNNSVLLRGLTLETGTWYPVYISAIDQGPSLFHIQLESLTKKLESLMNSINSIQLKQLPNSQLEAGMPCLARYSVDNSIYRAVILQVSDNVKVLYLDYGNKEAVSPNEIYQLPDPFRNTQMLSVECTLYQWPELTGDAKELARNKFESFSDRSLNCRVMAIEQEGRIGTRNIVQLYEDAQDIGQELRLWVARQQSGGQMVADQQRGAASPQHQLPTTHHSQHQWSQGSGVQMARGTISYTQVELVGTVDVFLSYHGRGPSKFYVQRADTTQQIQQIMREVASLVKTQKPLPALPVDLRHANGGVGCACLAQYSDGVWYRARVVDATDTAQATAATQVRVEFVDFGNADVVRLDQVCGIPPGLVTCLPAQAVACRLAGSYGTQSDSLVKPFLDIVKDNVFRIKVEKVLSNVCLVQASTTISPLVNINSELSCLVPSLALTPSMGNAPVQLLVTRFDSCNAFYGQQSARSTDLAIFLANLAEYCSRQGSHLYNGQESHVNDVCAVISSSDGNFRYYRCKIIREQRRTADVQLLDIGGTERVDMSNLLSLPQELKNQPEFGFQCSLAHSVAITDTRLRNLFLDNFIEVVKYSMTGDTNVVKLTPNNSTSLRNSHIIRFLKDLSPPTTNVSPEPFSLDKNQRLADLYDRQNKAARPGHAPRPSGGGGLGRATAGGRGKLETGWSKSDGRQRGLENGGIGRPGRHQESSAGDYDHRSNDQWNGGDDRRYRNGAREMDHRGDVEEYDDVDECRSKEEVSRGGDGEGNRSDRKFERGDLRNSLRERRAAREVTLAKPITTSYNHPRMQNGMQFTGKITWMFDPGHFYVQADPVDPAFSAMMESMQIEFRSGPFQPKSWAKGAPIAAKYQDGCWYRGKVLSQRGKLVDVYFVDFGNTDKVDASDVLALPSEFGEVVETQAVKCGLAGVEEINGKWDKFSSGFAKFFTSSSYSVEVIKAGRHCLVDLNGGQLANQLNHEWREAGVVNDSVTTAPPVLTTVKNRGEERLRRNRQNKKDKEVGMPPLAETTASTCSIAINNNNDVETKEQAAILSTHPMKRLAKLFHVGKYPAVDIRDYLATSRNVLVSHFNSWKDLWVQDQPDETIAFTKRLNESKELQGEPMVDAVLNVGDCCIAVWDNLWYRAVVMELKNCDEETSVRVHFPDYGNTEWLAIQELRLGAPILQEMPPLALRCKLDARMPNLERILDKSGYTLHVRFKSFFKNQFVIKLEKDGSKEGASNSAKEKSSKRGTIVETVSGKERRVSLAHLESVKRMWFVPEQRLAELNGMMEKLALIKDRLVPVQDVVISSIDGGEEEVLCAVRYSEDGEVYRVRVLEKVDDDEDDESKDGLEEQDKDETFFQVEFIDYGNQEVVRPSDILELPAEFKVAEPFGQPVNLKGAEFALESEELRENLSAHLMSASSLKLSMVSKHEATLIVDGKPLNLNHWLRYKEYQQPFNLFRHTGAVRINCYLSNTQPTAPPQVWIIEAGMLEALERMMQELQLRAKSLRQLRKADKGRLACARYSKDGDYYRVRIVEVSNDTADIHYMDFGNSETVAVKQLFELSKEFILHPGFAMKVEVDNKGDCRMLAPNETEQLIDQGAQLVAELVQPRVGRVRLYVGGERVGYLPPSPEEVLLVSPSGTGGDLVRAGAISALSPARLHLGSERMAVTTMVANSSFAVQDILYAEKIRKRVEEIESELIPVLPTMVEQCRLDTDCVYLTLQDDCSYRRLILLDSTATNATTVKFIDTQTTACLDLSDAVGSARLFTCPNALIGGSLAAPASVTLARLKASTQDRYLLPDRLVRVSVSVEDRSVKLRDTTFSVQLAKLNQSKHPNMDQLWRTCYNAFPMLKLELSDPSAVYRLNSEQLSRVRDSVVRSWLYQMAEDKLITNSLPAIAMTSTTTAIGSSTNLVNEGKTFEIAYSPMDTDAADPIVYTQQQVDTQAKSVKIHENLPAVVLNNRENLKLVMTSGDYYIVSLSRTHGELAAALNKDLTALIKLNPLKSTVEYSLALYTGASTGQAQRCLLLNDPTEQIAEVYLVDTGLSILCEIDELAEMPAELRLHPALVFWLRISDAALNHRIPEVNTYLDAVLAFNDELELVETAGLTNTDE